MEILLIPLVIVGLVALWLVMVFNGLIKSRNRTEEAWSDIEVQLKRRYDLIPNLVNTVKGYAAHEEGVFTKVTEARTKAMGANTMAEHAAAENMLTQTLKSLFAVAENYPALQASDNFHHLQRELVDAEDKISAARRFYNGQARDFNTKLQVFPTNMVGGMLGFSKFAYYDAPAESEQPVNVEF
ncbi:LemA family protein [Candidatus Uhrbacteria bacterium]|nr:LemA family protein [Candidatus Uhrbacteria bacterium]